MCWVDAEVRFKWHDCLAGWIAKGEIRKGLGVRVCVTKAEKKGEMEEEKEKGCGHKHRGKGGKGGWCYLRDVLGREGGEEVKSLKEKLEEVGEGLGEVVDEVIEEVIGEEVDEESASEVHGLGACGCAVEEGKDRWSTATCEPESEREDEWEEQEGCAMLACGPGSGSEIERWE